MARLIVLYPQPTDLETFDRRYRDEHAPMAIEKFPGLRHFTAGRIVETPLSPSGFSHFAELTFDSLDALHASLASESGQQTVAHALEISTGGTPTALVVEESVVTALGQASVTSLAQKSVPA